MAETKQRSQLIQQQIENLLQNAPPPVTQAERDQIMKGRKKQSDIDAGRAAIKAREEEVRAHNEQLERLNKEFGVAQGEEGVAAEKRKREESSDPISQIAIPAGIGLAGGSALSHMINSRIGAVDRNRIAALNEIADELGPTDKLTNSQMNRSRAVGAAKAAEKYAPASGLGRAGQMAARGLAYGIPGAAVAYEFKRYNDIANDESKPWEERQAAAKIANGLLGVGTGIVAEGGSRFVLQGGGQGEGKSMMRIETARDYAKRMDDKDRVGLGAQEGPRHKGIGAPSRPLKTIDAEVIPEAPPTKAIAAPAATSEAPKAEAKAEVGTKEYYRQLARDLNIKGVSRKTKAELIDAITEANKKNTGRKVPKKTPKLPGIVGPAAAAGLAYLASPDDAEAGTGGGGSGRSSALENAAIAGGGAYGTQKLISSLPKAVGRAASAGLTMATPFAAADAYDPTQEELNRDRNIAARYLPSFLRAGGIEEAYQMAQVPERSPVGAGPRLAEPADPDAAINEALGIVRRANGGRVSAGPIEHSGGGRTDEVPMDVPPGTYILPADIPSALGQGNTMAGMKVLANMFPPIEKPEMPAARAKDGRTGIPIIVAGGEYAIDPYHVAALADGDVEAGADMLDQWVQDVRQQHIQALSALPAPAQ